MQENIQKLDALGGNQIRAKCLLVNPNSHRGQGGRRCGAKNYTALKKCFHGEYIITRVLNDSFHVKKHDEEIDERYRCKDQSFPPWCSLCKREFGTESSLMQHIEALVSL